MSLQTSQSTLKPYFSPPSSSSSDTNFPILAITILGILTTSILLLSYYVFVIRCFLKWHRSDAASRLSSSRNRHRDHSFVVQSIVIEHHGLSNSAIRAIPTFLYRKRSDCNEPSPFHECAVCLNEFQNDERIRMLPGCLHLFHLDCIDEWLKTNANCPLCRSSIAAELPTPQATGIVQNPNSRTDETVMEIREEVGVNAERRSRGDECIDTRGKDEGKFGSQPMRRSLSMDSSADGQIYLAVQKILQQNPHFGELSSGEGSSSSSARRCRSFFAFRRSFGNGVVLPVQEFS